MSLCPCGGRPDCFGHCELPDFAGPICFHCGTEIDAACEPVLDAAGEEFCSTRCFVAVVTFGHGECCEFPQCAEGARCTLPTLALACDGCRAPMERPFELGPAEEEWCRSCSSKVGNAFAYQARAGGAA